ARCASLANSIATPRSLSGASVGVARNSLTLKPRKPGKVVQPNWHIIAPPWCAAAENKKLPVRAPARATTPASPLRGPYASPLHQTSPRAAERRAIGEIRHIAAASESRWCQWWPEISPSESRCAPIRCRDGFALCFLLAPRVKYPDSRLR